VSHLNANPELRGDLPPLILVVDDEPAVRRMLELQLRRLGYRAAVAEDGPEALALFRALRGEVALVLLDVQMPQMNGPATLAALQQIDPAVRCCFMSGFPENLVPHQSEDASSLGMVEILDKPFRLDQLEALLRAAVGPPLRTP
jgi:CheY-like chemotaxis protein